MLDLEESEPQDIGPRGKATTVHIIEQEPVAFACGGQHRSSTFWFLAC